MQHLATAYLSHRKGGVAVAVVGLFVFANGLGSMWATRSNARYQIRLLQRGPGKYWRAMLGTGGVLLAVGLVLVLVS